MSYQDLLAAISAKIAERIAARASELSALGRTVGVHGDPSFESLEARRRVDRVNHQIAKLSAALECIADAAGSQ